MLIFHLAPTLSTISRRRAGLRNFSGTSCSILIPALRQRFPAGAVQKKGSRVICHAPELSFGQVAPTLEPDDLEQAEETIRAAVEIGGIVN